jgi:hypothetical protein
MEFRDLEETFTVGPGMAIESTAVFHDNAVRIIAGWDREPVRSTKRGENSPIWPKNIQRFPAEHPLAPR